MNTGASLRHNTRLLDPWPTRHQDDTHSRSTSHRSGSTNTLRQQTLEMGQTISRLGRDEQGDDRWGHELSNKHEGTFRFGFRNLNSLPTQGSKQKNKQLIQDILKAQVDCFGATEVNLAWHNLPFTDQLHERFKGSLEFAHYMAAHNWDKQFKDTRQSGETMMITNGDTTARVCSKEYDHRRLGRWCSVLLRGKHYV
jgi:hypothetical protein